MTQGFNFPIPRPRGTPDQQAAVMAQNLRELEVWLNKFVRSGTVIDHGGLIGLADDDHTNLLNEARHDALDSDNPHSVTFAQAVTADAGTDISAAEAETLTDGSAADTLHTHTTAGIAMNFGDLDDVTITGIASGEIPRWNGSAWINQTEIELALDHGALGGRGDDDHTIYVLADGSRSITGTERFTHATNPLIFGVAGTTQFDFLAGTNTMDLRISNTSNVFLSKMRFRSANHATEAHDIIWLDSAGAERLRWDDSVLHIVVGADVLPLTDSARDLGSTDFTFQDLYVDGVRNRAGTLQWNLIDSQFETVQRFLAAGDALIFGPTANTQMSFNADQAGERVLIRIADSTNAFKTRIALFSDDAVQTTDIWFFKNNGSTPSLQWDESEDHWAYGAIIVPNADVTFDIGTPLLTWRNLFIDTIKDRAGASVYSVQNATFATAQIFSSSIEIDGDLNHDGSNVGFYGTAPAAQSAAYTINATAVPDRTLLASASATIVNNNNVLAALLADLQSRGFIG